MKDKLPDRLKERDKNSKVFEIDEENKTLKVYYKEYMFTINGKLETEGSWVGKDNTAPNVTFFADAYESIQNVNLPVVVEITDEYSEVNTSECKYIVSTEMKPYGDTSKIWKEGTVFLNNKQEIVINKDTGIYYLHVLAIDTKENRKEYVSQAINIQPKTAVSIKVVELPVTQVTEGLPANVEGMKVEVTYNNGDKKIITSGFTVEGMNSNTTVGTRELTVNYEGKTTKVSYTWVTKQPISINLVGSPVNKYIKNEIGPNWNNSTLNITYNNGTKTNVSPESCWTNKWSTNRDNHGRYRSPDSDGNYTFNFSYSYGGKTVTTSYNYTIGALTGKVLRNTNELFDMIVSQPTGDVFKAGKTITIYRQSDGDGSFFWLSNDFYRFVESKDIQLVK